ncbi:MAG: hypothetical protein MPJ24_04160 [Pirellulaceae bacterium]|nr:hypothetical protein [Pirellulaceae bacterium]
MKTKLIFCPLMLFVGLSLLVGCGDSSGDLPPASIDSSNKNKPQGGFQNDLITSQTDVAPKTTAETKQANNSFATQATTSQMVDTQAVQAALLQNSSRGKNDSVVSNPAATPEEVTKRFMHCWLKENDQETLLALLTPKARKLLPEYDIIPRVGSSELATYVIGNVKYVEAQPRGAHVESSYSDQFEGLQEDYNITWVLREEPEGWRIVGMAYEVSPEKGTQFLNFENPQEILSVLQGDGETGQ